MECTSGQRAKGQRGIHPRPGRQALFKQARNAAQERGEEEEGGGEGTSLPLT